MSDFGTRGRGMLRDMPEQMDVGLDTEGLVRFAFNNYDEQVGAVHHDVNLQSEAGPDLEQTWVSEDEELDDDVQGAEPD